MKSKGSQKSQPDDDAIALRNLQTTDPRNWSISDVAIWLDFIALSEYKGNFVDNKISGEELFELDNSDLRNLGVDKLGHRKKFLRKIRFLAKSSGYAWTVYSDDGSDSHSDISASSSSSGRTNQTKASKAVSKVAPKKSPKRKTTSSLTLKCKYKGEWTVLKAKRPLTLRKLRKLLQKEYKGKMTFRWYDEDGDLIKIKTQKHLTTALSEIGEGPLRLNLTMQKKKKTATTTLTSASDSKTIENLTNPTVIIDKVGIISAFNRKAEELFGYSKTDVINQNVSILMPTNTAESHDFYLWRYQRDRIKRIIGLDRKLIAQHKDGTTFPMFLNVSENPNSFTGVITPLDKAKGSAASELMNFHLLDNLLQSVYVINSSGNVLFANKQSEILSGYASSEIQGKNIKMIMPEPYSSNHDKYIANYIKTRDPKVIGLNREFALKTKCGKSVPIKLTVTEQGVGANVLFTGLLTVNDSEDIPSNTLLSQQMLVLKDIMVAAIIIDNLAVVKFFNKSAEDLLGFTSSEIIGGNINRIIASPDRENHDRYVRRYLKTGKARVLGVGRDVVAVCKDGLQIHVKLSVTEFKESDGKTYFTGIVQKL